ncbi:MAG: hypothetical protein JWN70_5899 [Planctomycetaceae bacterium]|nr:hypothetical protein [Planctomycetaceae bacterium]
MSTSSLSRVFTSSQISLRPYYPQAETSEAPAADHFLAQNITSFASLAMIVAVVAYLVWRM